MSGDGIATMAQPQPKSQSQSQLDTGDYTFSSSSFRKKKKGSKKKIKTKKLITITAEEAASKPATTTTLSRSSALTRSQSMSALMKPTTEKPVKKKKKTKSLAPKETPAIANPQPTTAAPKAKELKVETKKSTTKSRGQRELELELELSPSGSCRDICKPWETDIRDKEKSERGERILSEGVSKERISNISSNNNIRSRAASHHRNFRRARSLSVSTKRHRSLSSRRYRSPSVHRRSLFSEWDVSSSDDEEEEDATSHADDNEFDNEFDDCDQTYETYRQFLASSKNTQQDHDMSRKSVLSLKQKVGAAPSMEISYRYSAAADELLNAQYDDVDKCTSKAESKSTTEEMTNPSEPEDPAIDEPTEKLWEHPAFLGAASPDIDPSNDDDMDDDEEEERQPMFLGAIGHEYDANTSKKGEHSKEASSLNVEEKATSGSTVLLSDIVPLDVAPSNDSSDGKKPPVFLGDVAHDDDDASVDSLFVEDSCKNQESSLVVEEKANNPLSSPVTVPSPPPPSSTCSRSPSPKIAPSTKEERSPSPPPPTTTSTKEERSPSPKSTAPTKEDRSASSIRQPEEQEKDCAEGVLPDSPRLSAEVRPSEEKEWISSESESDMVDRENDSPPMMASEEKEDIVVSAGGNTESRNGCAVEAEEAQFDSNSKQDDAGEIGNENKALPSDLDNVQIHKDASQSGRIQILYAPSLLDKQDENIDERDSIFRLKDFDTEMPPLLKRSPTRSVDDADSPLIRRKSPARINDSEDAKPIGNRGRRKSPMPTVHSDEDKPISLNRRKSPSRRVDSDDDKPVNTRPMVSDANNRQSDNNGSNKSSYKHKADPVVSPSTAQCASPLLDSEGVDQIQGHVNVQKHKRSGNQDDGLPETHSLHSLDSEDFDSILGPAEDEDCNHGNAENPQCPDNNSATVIDKYEAVAASPQSQAPKLQEVDPIHDISGHGDVQESLKESTNIQNDNELDESGDIDDSSFQDFDEEPDPDYPEEEREYISLLYDIYMH